MTERNAGIGHLAARSLIEEIAELREDIREQGTVLKNISIMLGALYCDLHAFNRERLPQPEATAAEMLE